MQNNFDTRATHATHATPPLSHHYDVLVFKPLKTNTSCVPWKGCGSSRAWKGKGAVSCFLFLKICWSLCFWSGSLKKNIQKKYKKHVFKVWLLVSGHVIVDHLFRSPGAGGLSLSFSGEAPVKCEYEEGLQDASIYMCLDQWFFWNKLSYFEHPSETSHSRRCTFSGVSLKNLPHQSGFFCGPPASAEALLRDKWQALMEATAGSIWRSKPWKEFDLQERSSDFWRKKTHTHPFVCVFFGSLAFRLWMGALTLYERTSKETKGGSLKTDMEVVSSMSP